METLRSLAALCEPPGDGNAAISAALDLGPPPERAEWSDLFLFELPPYASIYLGPDGRIGGEGRDRVGGFWRALGLEAPDECDHLAILLAFYAELVDREAKADDETSGRWRRVREAFLWEHLVSWLAPWLLQVEELAPPFYRRWGRLLAQILAKEAESATASEREPLAWREASQLRDPRQDGARPFLDGLLTPVASGWILTRADVRRAARELGLAARVGERRFLLETLLSQDPAATLGWLEREARAWERRLAAPDPLLPASGTFWQDRAAATADFLAELRREAFGA